MPPHQSVIRGRLKSLSIADVLLFLRGLNRTGRVVLTRDGVEVLLDLRGPYVVRAASSHPDDRLEAVLEATGRLTPEQADDLRERTRLDPEAGIGRALIASGLLTPKDLVGARREQARRIVLRLFEWSDGEYHFEDGRAPSGWSTPVDLPILDLVADGIRSAETGLFAERLPSPDWVFEPATGGAMLPLEPHEERLLAMLDGKRTIAELESLHEFTASEARRILFLLLTLGKVRPRPQQGAGVQGEPIEKIVQRFNGIYGRVYQYMTIELGPISESLLGAALRELGEGTAPIFRRARLGGDGTIDQGVIEENLRRVSQIDRRDALVEGLNELLYRQLLVLRQTLGPEHERRVLNSLQRDGLLASAAAGARP